jgi:rhodanese-related sulfurtransferase
MSKHDPDFERLCDLAREEIAELSVHDVQAIMGEDSEVMVIDVREDHEWAKDHVAGARHIGRGILERDIAKHVDDKDTELVLYCGGGYRSALAALNLQKMGYTRVASMAGGIKAWRAAEYPIASD